MRLLVTIPHYFRRTPDDGQAMPGHYGSESGDAATRAAQVTRCMAALHQTFGPRQTLMGANPIPANTTLGGSVDILLVTTGGQHLVDELPRQLFAHAACQADPRHLGFVCHQLLREYAPHFDVFAYLEDDIEITDPLFFNKLAWFSTTFGHSAMLQPNRFERAHDLETMKLYVDGTPTDPGIPARYQDIASRPRLIGDAFGRSFLFERVSNVHSGCFFLNGAQLDRVAASPQFGQPTSEFFGPLESAATLLIMRAFEVYKPARENAGFLELCHLGRRFLRAQDRPPVPAEPSAEPGAEPGAEAGAEAEPPPPPGPPPPAGPQPEPLPRLSVFP